MYKRLFGYQKMKMSKLLCLVCLVTSGLISVFATTRSPIVSLLPRHLVAFYPLLADWRDYAPDGKINGYALDGYSRSNISFAPKLGARLEQGHGLEFPVNIHVQNFPVVTIGAWIQAGQAMAVNNGCLLSQNGLNTGRALCVERGKWALGDQVLDELLLEIDQWSFVAVVFGGTSTYFFLDGKMTEIATKVDRVASQRLVVGAAADQPLAGFTGYLRSVFVFDVALSEVELSYLMTTKEVPLYTPTPPVVSHAEPVEVSVPKPHLFLKDQVGNLVTMRQAIDPDGDEYNAALPTLDDADLLSVELVYDDTNNTVRDQPVSTFTPSPQSGMDGIDRPWIFRLSPRQILRSSNPQIIDIFGMKFANLTSLSCTIDGFTIPAKFISFSRIQCSIEPMRYDESISTVEIDVSLNGIDFTDDPRQLGVVNAPTIDAFSPDNGPRTGGTVVQISGHGFLENVDYSVSYGHNERDDIEYVNSNLLLWRTTGFGSTGSVLVELIVTEMVVPEIPSWKFCFTEIPQISSVFPQLLPVRSETTLTISGSGFEDFTTLLCSFRNILTGGKTSDVESWTSIATFASSSIVQCQTPSFTDADTYVVSVSNNGQDYSSASIAGQFIVHMDILLKNVSTIAGPAIGGTSVDITGEHFVRSTDVACRFGVTRARAYFVSDAVIRCISPAWIPTIMTESMSPVAVQIALNGLDFCTSSVSFQYYSPPIIDVISPPNAPMNTSLSLTLFGRYFIAYGGIMCRIGATLQVPGVVKSGGRMVQCNSIQTPAKSCLVEISVSLNGGRDFSQSQASLIVHEPVVIRGVDFPYVAKNSGASVSIRGRGFLRTSAMKCVFGEALTNASFISPELLTCSLPASIDSGRDYKLRVSLNNGLHVSSGFALVHVYDDPTFEVITPAREDELAILKVIGTGFVVNESFSLALGCTLGNFTQSVAKVVNYSSLECTVPDYEVVENATAVPVSFQVGPSIVHTDLIYVFEPTPPFIAQDPGPVPGKMILVFPDVSDRQLNISNPASGSIAIPARMPMAYVDIFDISPKFVDQNSRVNITVHGQNFQRNTTFCHFGSKSLPVPAIVKSHALVLCEFDGSIVEPGPINFAVSLSNLRPSVSTAAFSVVAAPTISSIYPKRGPLEGDTNVLIIGTGFIDNEDLYCHFDGISKVIAVRLTDTMVNCRTPPSRRGETSELRLSINSSIFSSNSIDFLYLDMPELMTVSPSYGDVGGGATVYLHGRSLSISEDSIDCTFGSSRALSTMIVNSTTVIVESPPSATGPRSVHVRCTSDGEVLTPAELSYHYLLTPYTSQITPQLGLATSQTTVLVDGTGFSDKYPMTCNFGEVSSSATVKSGSQVECVVPPQGPDLVNMNVVFGGSPVGNSSVVFEYIAEPVLQKVIPPLGSEVGSTRLLIVGERFARHADFSCAFSREDDLPPVTTLAFWASEQSIICVTPPYSPGPTVLQLAVGDTLSSSRLRFNFTIEPRVFSVVPQYSSGASNTTVVVNGAGFIDSDLARCSLGSTSVRPIRVESDSRIVCKFPRQFHSGVLPVRVTMNNQDFTKDTVLFALYPPVVVDYATPLYGLLDEEHTRVDLVGHNFNKLVDLICQIHVDDIIHTVAAIYTSPSLSTCFVSTPTQLYSINASVPIATRLLVKEVTHEDVIFAAPFRLLARPIPLTAFPNTVLSTGGQTIYFDGVNFAPSVDMVCQFESYFPYDRAPLKVVNSTNGFCIAPERAPGPVEVKVCFNDQGQCSYDSLLLSYVPVPVVHTLMSSGLTSGNSLVTVLGKGFYNVPMQCQFDGLTTPVTFVNQSTVVCPHSPLQDRCKSFSLYVDGINILKEPLEFCTQMAPMINMIRPTAGPDKGGTRVLVSGGPFTVNGGYWCRFGEIHVRAAYLSTTQIFCISPPGQSRTVNFSVSGNNFSEFDVPRLSFTYRPAPVTIAVSPSRGSQDGQYQVTIQGLNFVLSAGLRCRFGDSHIVAGKWLSDTTIVCVVPSHSPGWVDIQVTNNLQDYSVEKLRFEFVVSPTVLNFEPVTMYAQNPKELTIFGRNFQNSTNLRCIIGNDLTYATFASDTKIRCAPANLVESAVVVGVIDLKLSMIGSFVQNRLKVLDDGVWYLRPRITSVRGRTPIVLSRRGNDEPLSIEVYYGRFCPQSGRVCSELTPTDLKEPSEFNWFPPRWVGPDLMGVVEFFRVTNTSITPSAPITTFPFRYYREVEFSKLTPSFGSTEGGTIVTLMGAHFQDSRNLSCVLNGVTFTPAHFITDTMITCAIPPFVSGPRDIGVFVSLNGLEVSESSLSFKYEEDPSVFSIFPVGGPVTGFTIVSVKGAHFISTPRSVCSFGQHIVSAIVVSSTEVTCTVHPSSWNSEGSVLFRFSSNGQEFSKEKVSYLFYEDPSRIILSPRVGSVNGGTIITITWSQVVPGEMLEHLSCEIGSFVATCNLINGTSVGLTVPQAPGGLEGPIKVRVSLNGQNYVEGSPFWYLKDPEVYFVYPNSSGETSTRSDDLTAVRERNSAEDYQLDGKISPLAESVSESSTLPSISSVGTVAVSVSNNDVNVEGLDTKLIYHSSPIVKSISPRTDDRENMPVSDNGPIPDILFEIDPIQVVNMIPDSGPVRGGSVVILEIDRVLDGGDNLVCHFGDNPVHAVETKLGTIICRSPPAAAPGQVLVGVTMQDRSSMSNGTHKFTYLLDEMITSFSPKTIMSSQTNVNLTIHGLNFYHNDVMATPLCQIDKAVSRAFVVSSTQIICPPPQLSAGQYSVSVACDGVNFVTSSSNITYISPVWITAAHPSVVAASGGMQIEVKGTGFVRGISIECNFGRGRFITGADVVSSSTVICETPSVGNHSRILSLSVCTNTSMSNEVLVSFVAPIVVISATPNVGFSRGGRIVKVDVSQVPPSGDIWCFFGDVRVGAQRLTPYQIGCKSPPFRPEQVKLTVEGEGIVGSSLLFTFLLDLEVDSVSPTRGSSTGGTEVNLALSGVVDVSIQEKIMCRFGAIFVQAEIIKKNQVTCISPLGSQNEGVVLAITVDGDDVAISPVRFQYFASRELLSIEPRVGSLDGNLTMLAVLEKIDLGFGIVYDCSFEMPGGDIFFSTAQLSLSGELLCRVPAFKYSYRILVSIWQNRERYSSNSLMFEAILTPTIDSVTPTTLTELAEIRIRVVGTNFSPYHNFKCIFGDAMITQAEVISRAQLECESPQLPPGNYSFGVSWNAQEIVRSETFLTVVERLSIKSIQPSAGFRDLQPEIRVIGSGFYSSSSSACRFGEMKTSATYINQTEIRCRVPLLPTLLVQLSENLEHHVVLVELSLDGKVFVSSEKATFTYYSTPRFGSIYPSSGSVLGHTRLFIRGMLDETLQYNCLIDGVEVPGALLNSSTLSCFTPAVDTPGRVQVSVGVLGVAISSEFPLWFTYYDPPMILSVSPDSLKTTGGDMVILSGRNFIAASAIQCLFSDSIPTPATFISSTSITCIAPPRRNGGYVSLEMTTNGVDYTESYQSLYYFDYMEVLSVAPELISTSGGIELYIKLTAGSTYHNESIECLFVRQNRTFTRPAYTTSPNEYMCYTPMWSAGKAAVGILLDGKQRFMADTTLEFISEPWINALQPSHGPATGGTVITVLGRALGVESIMCFFDEMAIAPQTITESEITCITPTDTVHGSVVSVSIAIGSTIRSNTVEFTYDLPIQISAVSMEHIPESGESVLTVIGLNFLDTMELSCDIGADTVIQAIFVDSTVIRCPIGEARGSPIAVGVSNNWHDFIFFETPLNYMADVYITPLSPASGSMGGASAQLTLVNTGSLNNEEVMWFCSFGDQDSRASVISNDTVACIPPGAKQDPVLPIGFYWRMLTLNDRSDDEKPVDRETFVYQEPFIVYSIFPVFGVLGGNTKVQVLGSNFLGNTNETDLVCVFGTKFSPLQVINTSHAECLSPSQRKTGDVKFTVRCLKDVSLLKTPGLIFYYHKMPTITRIIPSMIRATNTSSLRLVGSNFIDSLSLSCLLENIVVPARFISSTSVECVLNERPSGTWLPGAAMSVEVSNNGQDVSNSESQILVQAPIRLTRLEPSRGPIRSRTSIKIFAEFMSAEYQNLKCHVGETQVVLATNLGNGWTECALPVSSRAGTVQISLSVDGVYYAEESLRFTYEDVSVVYSIYPTSGPFRGGTTIDIHGEGFGCSSGVFCVFGSSKIKARVKSPLELECISPPYISGTDQAVSVAVIKADALGVVPAVDSLDSIVLFSYAALPEVVEVTPSAVHTGERPLIVLQTTGIHSAATAWCKFGLVVVKAEPIDPVVGTVSCQAPELHAGRYLVEVSANERDFSESRMGFSVSTRPERRKLNPEYENLADDSTFTIEDIVEPEEIAVSAAEESITAGLAQVVDLKTLESVSVNPVRGPIGGGTRVVLKLSSTYPSSLVFCQFGTAVVRGTAETTEVECAAPPVATAKTVELRIGANGVDFEIFGANFEYFADVSHLLRLMPLNGVLSGGTLLHIFGIPFDKDVKYSCKIGGQIVKAEYTNETHVGCRTPAVSRPSQVIVKISNNDFDYSEFNLAFAYVDPLFVSRIYPVSGDIRGGQFVTIIGGNFTAGAESLQCRFGDTVVQATVFSSSTAQCVAPEIPGIGVNGAKVAVEVSSNGQDYSTSGMVYSYTPPPNVLSLEPNHGPLQGGTEVVVTGTNFLNSSSLRCKFGESVTAAAAFLDSKHFTCVSPSGFKEGDVYVEIANHGLFGKTLATSMFTDSKKVFTYDSELEIHSVFPSSGPTTGNFSVQITGGKFRKTDAVHCKFSEIVVVATWVSYDEILCMAPPHSAGVFTLEVTRNAQDYTDSLVPFTYYAEQGIRSISPTFGPAFTAGTRIDIDGVAFVNSSLLSCRFGYVVTPGEYVSPTKMRCTTPPLPTLSGGLISAPLPEYRNQFSDPNVGSVYLFPDAHYYPHYLTRLVSVEVSNNQQDFSLTGINFLYFQDETLVSISPTEAFDSEEPLAIFAYGRNFINTTMLACRLGLQTFPATFITSQLLLCEIAHPMIYDDARRGSGKFHELSQPRHSLFEISNNGRDFTSSHVVFEFLGACPTGFFCPKQLHGSNGKLSCPRGTYCPGVGNTAFTLCPRGTYQPKTTQAACLRCPIGYHCPHTGMHVPRLCPAGFVCDVTGIEEAEQPCPEGHYCLEGTATVATTCTPTSSYTGMLIASTSSSERPATLRRQRRASPLSSVQTRKSGCWRNETEDFGLQLSDHPSRFWMELRQLPLSPSSSFKAMRGRFCLDDSCMKLADADNLRVEDVHFDYDSTDFALRRPVACPAGSYCHPGTATSDSLMKNFSTAQPCFEAMYCPEGSSSPRGFGECAPGFYCPFGTRIPCPAGSYCPLTGHIAPLPCPPGTLNGMTAQSKCTSCPVGFICPGYGRIMPALCPAGYVCSKTGLASPNSLCPRGFYCLEGTATSDGFRNDTRMRPYPCKPGTYCLKGVVADEVRFGDYRYPQNCTAGFYCELGSFSPKGSGLCPPGFTCPSGTAAPIPTAKGAFAQLEGSVSAAECAPGYYAPTIESTECVPCPPGTTCENDGTAVATICPPGSYRGSLAADGLACLACPQGSWSKNWELRGVEECVACAPGTVCPIDGISNPCTVDDLPFVYTPLSANLTFAQCLERGSNYFFGVLLEPWIDELGRGAHFLPDRDNGRCYENAQPRGSDLYQRFADFHGPLYEIATGTGVPHQGYGDDGQYPPPNMFARGSLAIDLPVSRAYDVSRNCTPGFFYKTRWYPGTCEADIFCSSSVWSKVTSAGELVGQAQPCPEGYVCDASTTADTAFSHLCPAGYVCGAGTTPDLTLDSPRGQLRELCPAGKYCVAGTAESQKERYVCPAGYFCPTGTANPLTGEMANDALRRRLSSEHSNPFLYVNYTKYVGEGDIRAVSAHDMRCFDGIDEDLIGIFKLRPDPKNAGKKLVVNRAEEQNRLCARDHKWRMIELALRRNECDCVAQTKVVRRVFQLWKCTTRPETAQPVVFDPKRFGWADVHNSAIQCVFPGSHGSKPVNLTELVVNTSTGVRFQIGWKETTSVHSYTELRTLVETKYAADILPVDPYMYDLHHAIELIDSFGEEVPSIAGFVTGSSEEVHEDLIRLDACACSQMFKCPNGTTSTTGVDSIYHCVKTGDEVLQRISPIPLASDRLLNGTVFQDLTGTSGHGLGSILLEPFEVAVVTINTTQLARNLTYDAHYQISVYQDCKPCPPQYKCDLSDEPPSCTYPDNDNTTASRLYEKCLADYNGDIFVCNNMPFFCDRRKLPLADLSRDAFYSGSNETTNIAGCCSCERQQMPYFFQNAATTDRGFPDNKHGYLQFSVSALGKTEITIAVELVHGLYVREFVEGFTEDKFDLTVFTPGRADYSPSTPSTNTFLAVMQQADMDQLMLPLNLPEEYVRVAGSLTYKQQVASTVLINRMSDIFVGDPELPLKRGFVRNSEQNSIGELISVDTNSSTNGSTDTDAVVVSPTYYFGLYSVPDRQEVEVRSDSWWAQELGGSEFLALPYLPYFSSCRGFDSNIYLFKMLETHPDCTFVSYDQTVEVDQYPWRKKLTPNADRCLIQYTAEVTASSSLISSISSEVSTLTSSSDTSASASTFATFQRGVSLSCLYEENLEGGAEKLRWYETPSGTTLFYITRDPTAADAFVAEGDAASGTGWGRSDTIQNSLGTDALIPVKVGNSAGLPLAVPQEVYLNLSYYQVTPGQKRLVEAYVNFGKLCAVTRSADLLATLGKKGVYPCAISKATNLLASKAYTLQVSWEPLNWFELMNLFQFTVDVYLGFFTLVAMASMILGFVIWVINRLFTKMKRPPKFRMKLLLKNVATPPPIGIFMASIPIFLACVLIYIWWHVLASTDPLNNPSVASFEATTGDWLDQISLDKTRVQKYKRGRVGLSLVIIGIYLLLLGSKLLVPETLDAKPEDNAFKEMSIVTPSDPFSVEADKEDEEEENEFWDPRAWKRANFLLTTVCFMGCMLVFWEFSYSPAFTENIYGYLVLFKIMRALVEFVLEGFLHEKLLVMPFAVVLSVSESMMAMGSADFIGFTLFYFVNLTLVMIEHLYTAPLVRRMRSLWPKWRLSLQRKMKKRRRRTREQKAQEEAEWQRVCERIDNQASGVEAVLEGVAGYSVVFTELFIAPILLAFQAFFSDYTRIPALYGVRQTDLLYYALFSVFIIPSNFVLGALQLNTMELAHGWKLYEYSAYQRHRFATRDTRWPLAHTAADESIHPSCQSLDLLCFSSQLYFLLIVYSAGILLSMLGISVCLRASYSFFGDQITLLIIGVVYYLMRILEISCIKLGDKFKVWKPRKLADGTLDEDLAAKLALGAGRQRELEQERLELQALNSERFRHRFLERNRPWVLQHLAELFTPRTLQATDGPAGDGRPNSEYIRDLYHELVNMGEGRRLKGDRSDISSDSEDELEKMRRSWSNVPVEGASRDLALYWLARARKRRTFAKLIAGIVAASRQSECCVCGKNEDGGYTLHVDLAAEDGAKEHDVRALDRLIDGFESELGEQEMDSDLWKAYFRKHAAFATLCNVCLTSRQQALGNRAKKLVDGMRKLRADEFSSDEGSDEDGGDVPFAPIVVARGATEGRVLTKWLLAARKRLGGTFPRPEAQEEMERYARKLKRSRRRAGKTDHVDSDEEGKDPSRHWRLELNEAARALALRWVWEARDLRDTAARNAATELREKLQALNDQIVEADDWFFGRELREAGLALRDDGVHLAEEQARVDEDLAQKIRATERDVETFVEEKRATTAAEEKTFAELIAKEREDAKARVESRELELLETYKQKETEFAAAQRQAREAGELVPALVTEHRTYLAKMAEDRRTELESMEEAAHTKAQQKEDAFARKLALGEAAAASRRALAQHRILALRKEARGVVRARESAWQSKARSWIDRASRKVQVKQQEDAEAQLHDKRRRKRVLLAT